MKQKIKILLADDDPVLRKLLPNQLSQDKFAFATAQTGTEALLFLAEDDFDVVLLDVNLPEVSGLEILAAIRRGDDAPEVVMLTADKSLATGLEAMRRGAYEYLTKPADPEQIEAIIIKAAEKHALVRQNSQLKTAIRLQTDSSVGGPVHNNPAMQKIFDQAAIVGKTDSTLLITGESGTGKDVLARWIHSQSPRADLPFISVNCGALPENLFESEFFGHEKGAFTGAAAKKIGLIESAEGSTLFLDEIGEMPPAMQVKLLHFLENGAYRRVGATRDRTTDVRVIAATNAELEKAVEGGKFRSDLFYRLNVIAFHLPPLRERKEDIPGLLDLFLSDMRRRFNRPGLDLSATAMAAFTSYSWPGNIRELKNTLERSVVLTEGDVVEPVNLAFEKGADVPSKGEKLAAGSLPTLGELEKAHIRKVLAHTNGRREQAAAILGITSRTLYRKLKELDLER